MSSAPDPDVDFPNYGILAEARFRPKSAWPPLDMHVNAVITQPAPDGTLVCDAASARPLYDDWIAPRASEEKVAVNKFCHEAFLGALIAYVEQAVAANNDSRTKAFVEIRDVLLTLLRDIAALEERPLGERPDFTGYVSAQLATKKSPSVHLAAAILFEADYIPDLWPAIAEDPIFELIRQQYFTADSSTSWETQEARHLFESASYYIVDGGPRCLQHILARMSGVGTGETDAAACQDQLHKALERYQTENQGCLMDYKRDWTLLNLVFAAKQATDRMYISVEEAALAGEFAWSFGASFTMDGGFRKAFHE